MEIFRAIFIVLVFYFINTTSAQYRLQESLFPQKMKIQRNQPLNFPAGLSSLDFLTPPHTQIPRPRYDIKATQPTPKVSKRQYLAEVFKQSAINNLVAAASAYKEPVGMPLSNKMAYKTNAASDIPKWRL